MESGSLKIFDIDGGINFTTNFTLEINKNLLIVEFLTFYPNSAYIALAIRLESRYFVLIFSIKERKLLEN